MKNKTQLSTHNLFLKLVFIPAMLILATPAFAANRTWDGGGATNNWSEAANWSGDTVPTVGDSVFFNVTSAKNCVIDVNVNGIVATEISSFYTGMITQNANVNLGNFQQAGGTFAGGNGSFGAGTIQISGGAFRATSGTTTLSSHLTVTSGAFDHNGGEFVFFGSTFSSLDVPTNLTFNNLTVNKTTNNFNAGFNVAPNDTVTVAGTLNFVKGRIDGIGTLEAQGNVTFTDWGGSDAGNGRFLISGAATRTITLPVGAGTQRAPDIFIVNAPNATINTSGAGTIQFAVFDLQSAAAATNGAANFTFDNPITFSDDFTQGAGNLVFGSTFTFSGGTFTGGTGNLSVTSDFTVTSGVFSAPSGTATFNRSFLTQGTAVFNAGAGTVVFGGGSGASYNVAASPQNFNNLEINQSGSFGNIAAGDTLRVNGTLRLTNGILNGDANSFLEARGDLVYGAGWDGGTAHLLISGAATRTVTLPSATPILRLTFDAPNLTVVPAGNITFINPVNVLNVASFGNGGFDFTFGESLLSANAPLTLADNFAHGAGNLVFFSPYTQNAGGNFLGGSGNITFHRTVTINAGTFRASQNTTEFASAQFDTPVNVNDGTFDANNGTVVFSRATSSVNIAGTSAGTLTLNNLTINKNNTEDMRLVSNDTIVVVGTLNLVEGAIGGGSATNDFIEARGAVSVGANFDGGTTGVRFGGAANQTYTNAGGVNPVRVWEVNKSGGTVNLASDLNLTNGAIFNFNLVNGTITTGANAVILGTRAVSRTNGFVIGNLRRTFTAANQARVFDVGTANGYAPATITPITGSFPAEFLVRGNDGTLPGANPNSSLTRNWTLEPAANGVSAANIRFQYNDADVPGGANENNFKFLRRTGSTTSDQGITTLDANSNFAVLNNVTQFSDWTLGVAALNPTAATVTVGGRVTTDAGRGISKARVSLTDQNGATRIVLTNQFGYYRFDEVAAGTVYVVGVSHKRFEFPNSPRVVFVTEETDNLNFAAQNQVSNGETSEIGGQVIDSTGAALSGVEIEISGGGLTEPMRVVTDEKGSYRFPAIPAGDTYILTVSNRKLSFAPLTLFVAADRDDVNFTVP